MLIKPEMDFAAYESGVEREREREREETNEDERYCPRTASFSPDVSVVRHRFVPITAWPAVN